MFVWGFCAGFAPTFAADGGTLSHAVTDLMLKASNKQRFKMAKSSNWGLCKNCKWWQVELSADIKISTLGLCIDEELQPFLLRVSGDSGCNRYMKGEPARAPGSSEAPPTAKPVR